MYEVRFVGEANIKRRIKQTFAEYERQAYDIFAFYAAEIMRYFAQVQLSVAAETKGEFWTNHTFKAAQAFFAKAFQVPGKGGTALMGVTLAYTADPFYTEVLEFGHGGFFAAFPSLIERFFPMIIEDLKKLYGDTD